MESGVADDYKKEEGREEDLRERERESNYCQGRNIRPLVAALGRGAADEPDHSFREERVSQVCGTRGEP